MTKEEIKARIEELLYVFWEDCLQGKYPNYTNWYYSEGGAQDKLKEILEVKND